MTDRAKEIAVIIFAIAMGVIGLSILVASLVDAHVTSPTVGADPVLSSKVSDNPKEKEPMKQTLFAILLLTSSAHAPSVLAQDSVVLKNPCLMTPGSDVYDARMIHDPFEPHDSTDAWLNCLLDRSRDYILTPMIAWNCQGADSVAIYVRCEDTLSAQLLSGYTQNDLAPCGDLRGINWTRIVWYYPKSLFGLWLSVDDIAHYPKPNELGARCFFGSVTAYYPAKAIVQVEDSTYNKENHIISYYDLLGRPRAKGQVVKALGGGRFLVLN